MIVTLLYCTPNADELIEHAARVCYNSVAKQGHNPNFVQSRIREGHESITEHASAIFEVSEVSRSCLQQVARHGLMGLSVESQRYVDQKHHSYIVPDSIVNKGPKYVEIYVAHVDEAFALYELLTTAGISREDARYILPECNYTKFVLSGNFRMWRNFIRQRSHKAAQWEIRHLSDAVLGQLYSLAPQTFQDLMSKQPVATLS